jgi:hypothetical protein
MGANGYYGWARECRLQADMTLDLAKKRFLNGLADEYDALAKAQRFGLDPSILRPRNS